MEADQEQQKHRCKVCTKSFSSGRSLGGHMRSHAHSTLMHVGKTEKLGESGGRDGLGLGYGLRENPKKTIRASDFAGKESGASSEQCKACGKGFSSWKALFGHMRCHSGRACPRRFEEEEEDEASLGQEKVSIESFSDDNEELSLPPSFLAVPKRKRWSKRATPVITAGSSSSVTGYEPEQEDVAISLMMLSRAVVGEFSDKNSLVLDEEEEDSVDELRSKVTSSSFLRRKRAALCNSDYHFYGFNVSGSRYQCITCKKIFHSYQALGGHRANHRRNRNCCVESIDAEASPERLPATNQKSRTHECAICGKIFSSGQALGGHKRSHLVPNGGRERRTDHQTIEVQNPLMAVKVDVPELLDLNLPAPADEMSSNLKAWWAAGSFQNDQHPVSSVSN